MCTLVLFVDEGGDTSLVETMCTLVSFVDEGGDDMYSCVICR